MKCAVQSALLAFALAVSNPAAAAPTYSFDYSITGASALGIDRAFDDGKNTVLRFVNTIPDHDRPTVTGVDGTVLPTRVLGQYLVLPGIHRHVLVYSHGVVAQVQQGSAPPRYPSPRDFTQVAQSAPASQVQAQPATTPGGRAIVTSSVAGIQTAPAVVIGGPASAASAPAQKAGGFSVVADAPAPDPIWEAKAGSTLRNTTETWAKRAGWSVRWLLANGDDYEVDASSYQGEFTGAIARLYAPYFAPSFNDSKPLHVKAYAKQKILVVSE